LQRDDWWRPTTSAAELPERLQAAVAELVSAQGSARGALAQAAGQLSAAYREAGGHEVDDRTTALAYGAARLPATYASMRAALAEVAERLGPQPAGSPGLSSRPGPFSPRSHLDLGSGCGAALLAARSLWPRLGTGDDVPQVGVDRSHAMLTLARELLAVEQPSPAARLEAGELSAWLASRASEEGFELVTLGYVLGEVGLAAHELVGQAWARTAGVVVVVEAGTPGGYARIRAARDQLVAAGATTIAPCPHGERCPIEPPDWCHFGVRITRSPLHRRLKGGELGYEDEKFSYVAAARPEVALMGAERPSISRVLRHPHKGGGRVDLELCTPDGLRRERVGRSDPRYREWSRARWGAALEERWT
jgi:ribosomal protein RSM22 (predicted rRNA methylase)